MIAFLYAGQGSQKEAMGLDLYVYFNIVKEYFDRLDKKMNFDFKKTIFESSLEQISKTNNTQPSMVAFQIAITKLLNNSGVHPDYLAGLSIGEYSALFSSGVLGEEDAVRIARIRGESMVRDSENIESAMFAVLGMEREEVQVHLDSANEYMKKMEKIGQDTQAMQVDKKAYIANINCPGQIVISGEAEALNKACELLKEAGAKRVVPLQVSGPFHTEYMNETSKLLKDLFSKENFRTQKIPVVFNLTAGEESDEDIKEIMSKQVKSPVLFGESLSYMIDKGVDTFVEIGFGKSLSGFLKRIDRNVKVYEVNSVETLNAFLKEYKGGGKVAK